MIVQPFEQQIMGSGSILLVVPGGTVGGPKEAPRRSVSTSTCITVVAQESPTSVMHLKQSSSSSFMDAKSPGGKSKHPRKKKSVRFAPQLEVILCHVMHRNDMTEDDICDRFLVQSDVMAIRAHAKLTTKYYRLKDQPMIKALDACYNHCTSPQQQVFTPRHEAGAITGTDMVDDRKSVELGRYSAIDEWCGRLKFHGRGLERYCSEHQRTVRAQRMAYSRKRIVQAQNSTDITDETLAAMYRQCTQSAIVFARAMAQADQRAAQGEPTEQDTMYDERLQETVVSVAAAATTTTNTPQNSPYKLPRRKPSMVLRRFKSMGATSS